MPELHIQLVEEQSHQEMGVFLLNTITEDLKNLWNLLEIREEE
mgnify:CR=1 FL=1